MKKILIAFSAGPDSVFLYHYLKNKKYNIGICYVNHKLRYDVDEDIEFVKNFAKKENIAYFIEEIDIEKFDENNARIKRYEILERIRKDNNYNYIATGHNKNDNVETILFRLIRGTGLNGLKGIPKRRDNIIRPILHISKEYILEYLNKNNILYRIDYTNNSNDYSRNIIRNKIFPIMKEINTSFIENISKFIEILNEENDIKTEIKETLEKNKIAYNKNKIDEIYNIRNKNGASIKLNNKCIWYKSYNFFGIKNIEEIESKNIILNLGEKIRYYDYEIQLLDFSQVKKYLEKKQFKIYNVNCIDSLIIRSKKDGDKLDNKKLKKIFIDKKIDKFYRHKLPIICKDNEILILADILKSKIIQDNIEKTSNYIVIRKVDE